MWGFINLLHDFKIFIFADDILLGMSRDILITLTARFSELLTNNQSANIRITLLQKYLKEFPRSRNLKDLSRVASLFFHRQWIRISIRGHTQRVSRAIRKLKKGDASGAERELALALLWIGQAEKLYEIISFFKSFSLHELNHYIMRAHDLHTGDVVLSYKTNSYLRKSPVSLLVKFASNSSVTHAMIVSNLPHEQPELLFSGDITYGLGIIKPIPEPGEIFLVLESRDTATQTNLLPSISKWRSRAQTRMEARKRGGPDSYRFPELKCQMASIMGVFTVILVYIGIPLTPRNPVQSQSGVFCSELIDAIYKESGVILSPRSTHDAIVGPVEFLYSPLLRLRGIIANEKDLAHIQVEIRKQFFTH